MPKNTNELLLFEPRRSLYNESSIKSILEYALKLRGKSFEDILRENGLSEDDIDFLKDKSMKNKGMLGTLLEQAWFGFPANSRQEADFNKAGVELKSTPFEGEGENIKPGEAVSVTQIDFTKPQKADIYESHLYDKIKKILLVYYLRDKQRAKELNSKLFYRIYYVSMIQPSKKDLAIIEADYALQYGFIIRGDADKLTRTHGLYLGTATKSNHSEKVAQYYGEHRLVSKRAFVLKKPYLSFLLKAMAGIIDDEYGSVIQDPNELSENSFEDILKGRLDRYIGMEMKEIWERVKAYDGEEMPSAKNENAVLSCRMLGVTNNRVEELTKAGILPKIIKYKKKKTDNQQFRIEDFKFDELAKEEPDEETVVVDDEDEPHGWEASALYSYLADRQYLLIVFWEEDECTFYKGCQLWSMPDEDLETVHKAWAKTKQILDEGVELEVKQNINGATYVMNNLPGLADNGVFHIRNHANKSYYVINNKSYGNGTISDTDVLPNGDRMTKQAYWLNRSYIDKQLRPELVKEYT